MFGSSLVLQVWIWVFSIVVESVANGARAFFSRTYSVKKILKLHGPKCAFFHLKMPKIGLGGNLITQKVVTILVLLTILLVGLYLK